MRFQKVLFLKGRAMDKAMVPIENQNIKKRDIIKL